MLAVRLAFTAAVLVALVWLLRDGKPLALLLVPALALVARHWVESGGLRRLAQRS